MFRIEIQFIQYEKVSIPCSKDEIVLIGSNLVPT